MNIKLLKVKDIFIIQSLKFYYKYANKKLPGYFTHQRMFNQVNEIHEHNTRTSQSIAIYIPRTRRNKTSKSTRYSIPEIMNNFPIFIREKIRTHSFDTIKSHAKKFIIDAYQTQCSLTNCYICGT